MIERQRESTFQFGVKWVAPFISFLHSECWRHRHSGCLCIPQAQLNFFSFIFLARKKFLYFLHVSIFSFRIRIHFLVRAFFSSSFILIHLKSIARIAGALHPEFFCGRMRDRPPLSLSRQIFLEHILNQVKEIFMYLYTNTISQEVY